jgi:hypothetical protein
VNEHNRWWEPLGGNDWWERIGAGVGRMLM